MTVTAANKLTFGSDDTPLDMESIKESIVKRCFPAFNPSAPSSSAPLSQEGTVLDSS